MRLCRPQKRRLRRTGRADSRRHGEGCEVAPARRSPAALAKAQRKRTEDDLPVHSFRTLLTDLGTLAANTMQVAGSDATFTLQTQPTPLQRRCFELLGVTPRM